MQSILYVLSSVVSVYAFVCLVRVLMSWFPGLEQTSAGRFLAAACDPYLRWFRRFPLAHAGNLDLSPVIALAVLSAAAMSLSLVASARSVTVGIVLAAVLSSLWSIAAYALNLLLIILTIRLVFDLANRYGYSPFWTALDRFLNPIVAFVTHLFGRVLSYRSALVLTLVFFLALRVGLGYGVEFLAGLLKALPL